MAKQEKNLYVCSCPVPVSLQTGALSARSSDGLHFRTDGIRGMAAAYLQPLRPGRETSGAALYGEPAVCMSMCQRSRGPDD